ncbi:MAG: hypothetical protein OEZ00_00070 [Dehalococcoidia bacterium]|nr:hypothetical protein [Dehalococcoidia bacterium]
MSISPLLTTIGLFLNVIGALLLLGKPAIKWFRSHFSSRIKEEIEGEAIKAAWPCYAPEKREEQLTDSVARGFISTYKTSFFAFVLLLIGFLLQFIAKFLG